MAILLSRLVTGARRAPDRMGMLVIMAIVGGLTFQIFINIGMELGHSAGHRCAPSAHERRPCFTHRHLHRHRLRHQRPTATFRELERCMDVRQYGAT